MTRIDRHNLDHDCLYGGECVDCSTEQRVLDAWFHPGPAANFTEEHTNDQ